MERSSKAKRYGAGLVLFLLSAASGVRAAPVETVAIDNFMFSPMSLTVKAGTHVKFENHDDLPHTVVIPDLKQRSGMLDTDDAFEAVLDKPGKYIFFCSVHPKMAGEIVVTDK